MIEAVFVGIGSNLGDRLGQLKRAAALLEAAGCKLVRSSSVYATAAWGNQDQPDFLNAVLQVDWKAGPSELLQLAMQVETEMGRERMEHWGPRSIDIDILAMGEREVKSQRLSLPHPFIPQRAFVLKPWAEIAPDFYLPLWDMQVIDLLDALPESELEGVSKAFPPIQLPSN